MFHRVYVLMANKTEEFYNFILKLRCNYLINNDLEDLLEKLSELIYKYNDENVDSCEMHQQRHQLYRYTLLLQIQAASNEKRDAEYFKDND